MANISQNTFHQSLRRYTIPHLLQLASEGSRSFDLSKFTYDAARGQFTSSHSDSIVSYLTMFPAGIVPPLGDCAVSLRQTSDSRQRGWSTETVSTSDDVLGVQCKIQTSHLHQPARQPCGPPGESKNQKDEGFARFLKQHSSPTHNRVTAGGRIVPMEKRETPPKFELPLSVQASRPTGQPAKEGGLIFHDHAGTRKTSLHVADQYRIASASSAMNSPTRYLTENDLITKPAVHPASASKTADVQDAAAPRPELLPNDLQAHLGQTGRVSNWSSYGLAQVSSHMYHGLPGFGNYQNFGWPSPHMNLGADGDLTAPVGPFDPQSLAMSGTQQALQDTRNRYHALEQQLKTIDRHRATHHYDPGLSRTRLEVAHNRDCMRNYMRNLERLAETEHSLATLQGAMVLPPRLNVQAPAYVPQSATPSQESMGNQVSLNSKPQATQTPDKTPSAAKRKPIPIVPPPESSHIPSARKLNTNKTADNKIADIQLDQAPAHAVTQLRESTDETDTRSPSELEGVADFAVKTDSQGTTIGSEGTDLANQPASPRLHKILEIELDALRLPKGTVTRVDVSGGQYLEVVGVALQRPPGSSMTEFERKYWLRKPNFTREMLDDLKRLATIMNVEELDEVQVMGQRKVSDR